MPPAPVLSLRGMVRQRYLAICDALEAIDVDVQSSAEERRGFLDYLADQGTIFVEECKPYEATSVSAVSVCDG